MEAHEMQLPRHGRPGCPLCEGAGGILIGKRPRWRLIRADEPGFPAFYRLVWADHVAEFSELAAADRAECVDALVLVEKALRQHLRPDKINLASLGNVVPHLHWHVVARFGWDSHFPGSVWGAPLREAPPSHLHEIEALRGALEQELIGKLGLSA
jgi:diadenosine tetraphosphate (Ap4A) HIT family hydrolase